MSNTYTAWNGEEYPWPPPEGWYEASDDRWWAKDTGPGPKRAAKHANQATTIAPQETPQDANEQATRAVTPDNQAALPPTKEQPVQNLPRQNPANRGTQGQPQQGVPPAQQNPRFGQPQQGVPPPQQNPAFGQPQQGVPNNWQGSQPKNNTGLIIGIGAGALALVLLIGGVIFLATKDSDEQAIDDTRVTTAATNPPIATPPPLSLIHI